jgi:hypothetical protein
MPSANLILMVKVVTELKAIIDGQNEKLSAQVEKMHSLEVKLATLRVASGVRAAEDHHTSVKLAERQIAIAGLRRLANAEWPRSAKIFLKNLNFRISRGAESCLSRRAR